jgi:hypothetical protein
MDTSFKQEFLINAMSGASKSQIVRLYKEEMECSNEDIKELLSLPQFNKKPNFINYFKFDNLKIPITAKRLKFPFTQIYTQKNFLSKENCEILIAEIEKSLRTCLCSKPWRSHELFLNNEHHPLLVLIIEKQE